MDPSTPPSIDPTLKTIWDKEMLFQAMPIIRFENIAWYGTNTPYYKDEIAGTSFDD